LWLTCALDGPDREQRPDVVLARDRVGDRELRVDLVVVPAARPRSRVMQPAASSSVTMRCTVRSVMWTRSAMSRRRKPESWAMQTST
jgi:hypothetical protein